MDPILSNGNQNQDEKTLNKKLTLKLKMKINSDKSLFQGLYTKNALMVSGLVIAPVVVVANTLEMAMRLVYAFSAITFFTVLIASFIPRNIVYTVRMILYTFIASIVYVPTLMIGDVIFNGTIRSLGIFLPLLITNLLIVSKTELRFFKQPKLQMIIDVFCYIIGFDIAVLVFAFVRELISFGQLGDWVLGIPVTFSGFAAPFGGFILLGLFAAAFRKFKEKIGNK